MTIQPVVASGEPLDMSTAVLNSSSSVPLAHASKQKLAEKMVTNQMNFLLIFSSGKQSKFNTSHNTCAAIKRVSKEACFLSHLASTLRNQDCANSLLARTSLLCLANNLPAVKLCETDCVGALRWRFAVFTRGHFLQRLQRN